MSPKGGATARVCCLSLPTIVGPFSVCAHVPLPKLALATTRHTPGAAHRVGVRGRGAWCLWASWGTRRQDVPSTSLTESAMRLAHAGPLEAPPAPESSICPASLALEYSGRDRRGGDPCVRIVQLEKPASLACSRCPPRDESWAEVSPGHWLRCPRAGVAWVKSTLDREPDAGVG